jgi:hypothetical protein
MVRADAPSWSRPARPRPAADGRAGEIILKTPARRRLPSAGLAGAVVLVLTLAFLG